MLFLCVQKYVGRGPVEFVPRGDTKQRILFLVRHASYSCTCLDSIKFRLRFSQFTDILLVTSLTINDKYKIRHKFTLKNLLVAG